MLSCAKTIVYVDEWLFRCGEQVPVSKYSEDTSLQRTVKQLMMEGGHLGAGYGILKEKA